MSPDMSVVGRESLGQRIKALRISKGIRQIDLAERAGISWRHLIRIEQDAGGATKSTTVAQIAKALGVTVAELEGAPEEDDEEADPVADLMSAISRLVAAEVQKKVRPA